MSRLSSAGRLQIRVNGALDMIKSADAPINVRFAMAYAVGYIDALHDEGRISIDGARLYRYDAYGRSAARLAALLERDPALEAEITALEAELRGKRI